MPQVIIDLDDDENIIVENYSNEYKVSKARAIKAIIKKHFTNQYGVSKKEKE